MLRAPPLRARLELADLPSTLERRWHSHILRSHHGRCAWLGSLRASAVAAPSAQTAHDGSRTGRVTGRAELPPASPASATCRCRAPMPATVIDRRQMKRRRRAQPGRHHAARRRPSATPTTPGLLGLPVGARLRARQPLQLPPRRPADQRRNHDPAGQQGAASRCSRAPAACRPASARRAAWSTAWSSARPMRRCAKPRSGWRQTGSVLGARRPAASASATDGAFGCAPERRARTPRSAAARSRRQRQPVGAGRRLARSAPTRCSKPRSRLSRQSQPSQPGFSLLGNTRARPPATRAST